MKGSASIKHSAFESAEIDHSGHSNHDHSSHAAHSPAIFKQRFWFFLILTIPVLLYSRQIGEWFNFTLPLFPGSRYVPFILGTVIFFYGGLVFLLGAGDKLKNHRPG
ncbi:MAG: hypothetical protein R6U08_01450 [Bacillota bacterium]